MWDLTAAAAPASWAMVAASLAPVEKAGDRTTLYATIVIVVGIMATTLGQPEVLARLPIRNLLKNELHVGRAANAAFFFWAGLAWYFKPLAGIVTDAFPIFGSRRKVYLIVSSGLAVLAWIGLCFTPHTYGALLWMVIVINAFMVITSTVVGGYLVETAQAVAGSGRLTAIREIVMESCRIVNGPASGFLASVAFGWTAGACGGVVFLLVPVTIFFLHEQRKTIRSSEVLGAAAAQLKNIGTARTLWAAAGLMALFYMAPGFSTAVFYKQQTDLHMTTQAQGNLQVLYGVAGVAAALAYGWACRRLSLKNLLMICMLNATAATLGYLFYSSVANARLITAFEGWGFTLAELALMDLAVRATPAGSEGLGYSLMISVRNLALFGTDWLGSALLDHYHVSFDWLVVANAATTFLTVPLVLLLPAVLTRGRDEEPFVKDAAPREAIQD